MTSWRGIGAIYSSGNFTASTQALNCSIDGPAEVGAKGFPLPFMPDDGGYDWGMRAACKSD